MQQELRSAISNIMILFTELLNPDRFINLQLFKYFIFMQNINIPTILITFTLITVSNASDGVTPGSNPRKKK